MGPMGKIRTHICTFLDMYVYTMLLIVIYLHFNKALNSVLDDDLVNKIETYGTVKHV